MKISFFETTVTGNEQKYLTGVLETGTSFFEKKYIGLCEEWFNENHSLPSFFLTKSCTDSLELAAILLDIKPGDEVIMPSFAFVSCGNAFALRGAVCVFADINPATMNLDETKVEAAITAKTRAILTLNYAGVGCNYPTLRDIADKHGLYIIEDNAHGILTTTDQGFNGSFGDISTFSFDHMKNVSCGQGGGIAINNEALLEHFFVSYEFGTNRRSFFNKKADRYEWKGIGSNFQISEFNAALLYAQLQEASHINSRFLTKWNMYSNLLQELRDREKIELPNPPANCKHNGHCFYIKTKNADERVRLISHLHGKGINAQFHYTPLHSSEFGRRMGRFSGTDRFTTTESQRLVRLPLYYELAEVDVQFVVDEVGKFYSL